MGEGCAYDVCEPHQDLYSPVLGYAMEGGHRGWRWANVPIPEPHVAGLLLGLVLHRLTPWSACVNRRYSAFAGLVVIGGSVLTVVWSVWTLGRMDAETPAELVTVGPYARSRNPMYVAWTGLYTGVALLVNSMWLLLLLPAVLVGTHVVVREEERSLEGAFGDEYRSYRRTVRRYV